MNGARHPYSRLAALGPQGILAVATDNQSRSITTLANITNLSVTVNVGPDRRLKYGCRLLVQGNTINMGYAILVREGSTEIARPSEFNNWPTVTNDQIIACAEELPDSTVSEGSHTYVLSAQRIGGSGTLSIRGDGLISKFWVEDAGFAG